jgi:hypothetical protein
VDDVIPGVDDVIPGVDDVIPGVYDVIPGNSRTVVNLLGLGLQLLP